MEKVKEVNVEIAKVAFDHEKSSLAEAMGIPKELGEQMNDQCFEMVMDPKLGKPSQMVEALMNNPLFKDKIALAFGIMRIQLITEKCNWLSSMLGAQETMDSIMGDPLKKLNELFGK